jgi:hypothetical protein
MKIIILGPHNTGTNLLQKILENCRCSLIGKNLSPLIDNTIIWKHNFDFEHINNLLQHENNLVIFMYKNIFNWLFSMKKDSYEFDFKTIHGEATFNGLGNKELYNKPFFAPPKKIFKNIIEVYNIYYANYIDCLNKYKNIIFLDYAKIIDKTICFSYINNKLKSINLKIFDENNLLKILSEPSKNHGNSVKNSEVAYANYYSNQLLVKNFIMQRDFIKHFIRYDIISFYERH